MLASWWRILYPHLVDGAIAGSAPVLDFEPLVDDEGIESFSYIVTRDASPEGGSNEYCAENVRAAWPVIEDMAKSVGGRQELMQRFRICPWEGVMATEEDVGGLLGWLQSKFIWEGQGGIEGGLEGGRKRGPRLTIYISHLPCSLLHRRRTHYFILSHSTYSSKFKPKIGAWAYMAMGNYPFPSTYILNGQGTLPAWPVRVACESLNSPLADATNASLLEGLREAVSIYYNYTRTEEGGKEEGLECFDLAAGVNEESQLVEDHWTYQFCTEMFMPSGSDGTRGTFCVERVLLLMTHVSLLWLCGGLPCQEAGRRGRMLAPSFLLYVASIGFQSHPLVLDSLLLSTFSIFQPSLRFTNRHVLACPLGR